MYKKGNGIKRKTCHSKCSSEFQVFLFLKAETSPDEQNQVSCYQIFTLFSGAIYILSPAFILNAL